MDTQLGIAGALLVLMGVVHSGLGEVRIFTPLRKNPGLLQRHLGIVWASWHILSLLGFGLAGLFFVQPPHAPGFQGLGVALMASGLLVLLGTRGRHPGWLGLLASGLLVVLA